MSELSEKLAPQPTTFGTRATATLEQLQRQWDVEFTSSEQDKLQVIVMGQTSVWVKRSGRGLSSVWEKCDP